MNQREATVFAIMATLEARDFEYELNGPVPISEVLTDVDKKEVRTMLFSQFRDGDITFKSSFQFKVDDDAELNKYVSGLLNNVIRKAKEFNSGKAYVIKNPGSRAHSSDEPLRELKKLLNQVSLSDDQEAIDEVNEAIVTRKAQIKPKTAAAPINVDALPEHLQHLVHSDES